MMVSQTSAGPASLAAEICSQGARTGTSPNISPASNSLRPCSARVTRSQKSSKSPCTLLIRRKEGETKCRSSRQRSRHLGGFRRYLCRPSIFHWMSQSFSRRFCKETILLWREQRGGRTRMLLWRPKPDSCGLRRTRKRPRRKASTGRRM